MAVYFYNAHLKKWRSALKFPTPQLLELTNRQIIGLAACAGAVTGVCLYLGYSRAQSRNDVNSRSRSKTPADINSKNIRDCRSVARLCQETYGKITMALGGIPRCFRALMTQQDQTHVSYRRKYGLFICVSTLCSKLMVMNNCLVSEVLDIENNCFPMRNSFHKKAWFEVCCS